jgi:hypothetical protein
MRFAKRLCAVAAAFAALTAANGHAAVNPPDPKDLTMGEWELNVAKSKFGCTAAPKVSKRHMYNAGFDMMVSVWTGTRADGTPFDTRYVWRYDGDKYPAGLGRPDSATSEAIAWKLVDPHHVTFTHYNHADKVTQNLSREISADGQTMTQITNDVGKNCQDVQVFDRR